MPVLFSNRHTHYAYIVKLSYVGNEKLENIQTTCKILVVRTTCLHYYALHCVECRSCERVYFVHHVQMVTAWHGRSIDLQTLVRGEKQGGLKPCFRESKAFEAISKPLYLKTVCFYMVWKCNYFVPLFPESSRLPLRRLIRLSDNISAHFTLKKCAQCIIMHKVQH